MSDRDAETAADRSEAVRAFLDEAAAVGVAVHRRGLTREAERLYLGVLSLRPDHLTALQFLGVLNHQLGRSDQALMLLSHAIGLYPDDAGLYLNYGNVHYENRAIDEAAAAYERSIELDPRSPGPYTNLGVIRRSQQRTEEAEACYRKAIELAPDDYAAWSNLANLLLAEKRHEEAVVAAIRAVELSKSGDRPRRVLAKVYEVLGDIDRARAVYVEWLEADPENPIALHYLAALGGEAPDRASDSFVEQTFDVFADNFEEQLGLLEYRAPDLVMDAVEAAVGRAGPTLDTLDAGCGTGLCGRRLRPLSRTLAGVDLSRRMLDKAREGGLYDSLHKGELVAFMRRHRDGFDLVVSTDTLCYFGALEGFAEAARGALRSGGLLCFTTEAMPGDADGDFRLEISGRYVHAGRYIDATLADAGFTEIARRGAVLRRERGEEVAGWVVTARRP
jgi:predicted TPR repeat methyltransferase